jgi:RHS repeat-associated protein
MVSRYDSASNVTNDGAGLGHSYFYDAENRIIQVNGTMGQCSTATACYVYDAEGHRVRATVNGQTRDFIYDLSGRNIDEYTPGGSGWLGTWTRGEAYAGSLHIATYANGTTEFDNSDWLSTFRARSDVTGNRIETCTSLPFGENLTCTGTEVTPIHFTGKERDAESGNDFFGARYYTSTMGRFLTPDPGKLSLKHLLNPQKWNKYTYVLNDPLAYFDPDGQAEVKISYDAFIPQKTVFGFRGDNRSFSTDPNASARVRVTMQIETDPAKNGGNPLIGKPVVQVGETHIMGTPESMNKQSSGPTTPTATASQDSDGNVTVNLNMNMRDPFQPAGQGAASNVNITVNEAATNAEVKGTVSGSPSFEANFTPEGAPTTNLPIQAAPQGTVGFLVGLQQTNNVDEETELQQAPESQ